MRSANLAAILSVVMIMSSAVWAGIVQRPLPALSLQVTSTSPQPVPMVTNFLLSSRTLTPTDPLTISVKVANCPSCAVSFSLSSNPDINQWTYYTAWLLDVQLSAAGDGWFNTTLVPPAVTLEHPNGVYYALVVLQRQDIGLTNSYSPPHLNALFGGTAQLTLTGFATAEVPVPDYLSITPNTLANPTDAFAVAVRMRSTQVTDILSVGFYCSPVNVIGLGQVRRLAPAVGGGWFNFTGTLNDWTIQSPPLQGGGARFGCELTIETAAHTYILTVRQLTTAGVQPFFTLTGTAGGAFTLDQTPPSCNFSLGSTTMDVTSASGALSLVSQCSEAISDSLWYLAPPDTTPPTYLSYADQLRLPSIGSTAFIPEGVVAGTYTVSAIVVADEAGNTAVYSNVHPPLPDSVWQSFTNGEGWLIPQAINQELGEGDGASSGGAREAVWAPMVGVALAVASVMAALLRA